MKARRSSWGACRWTPIAGTAGLNETSRRTSSQQDEKRATSARCQGRRGQVRGVLGRRRQVSTALTVKHARVYTRCTSLHTQRIQQSSSRSQKPASRFLETHQSRPGIASDAFRQRMELMCEKLVSSTSRTSRTDCTRRCWAGSRRRKAVGNLMRKNTLLTGSV
ncbi:hypothetical protein AAT19DRAFT_8706 [Rhodotorula toruloides]|uniref:Uncharacterized protein n=1 Tax=Rhodotorula toruloides TaxID=5286 RepID=A0A2T0AI03_RHOTO|nr:hypothetical protein AAT19DRAFT_8706 [Rhodotorula toruloides]